MGRPEVQSILTQISPSPNRKQQKVHYSLKFVKFNSNLFGPIIYQ